MASFSNKSQNMNMEDIGWYGLDMDELSNNEGLNIHESTESSEVNRIGNIFPEYRLYDYVVCLWISPV